MQINFTLSMTVAPQGNIRIKAFETTALASPDATKDYDAPVANPLIATITVPSATPHIVKIYDSPGGSDDGTLLSEFLYDPSFNSVSVRDDKYYEVNGGAPAPNEGDKVLTDPDLAGYDYDVEIRGTGTMRSDGTEITINPAGGFSLTKAGDQFYDGQIIIIHFKPQVTTYTPQTGGSANIIAGIKLITADTTLDNTYYNQLLNLAATVNSLTVTLPALNTVPANTMFPMVSNSGNQQNVTIQASGTDKILWNSISRPNMFMGKNEQLWLMNGTDGWYVTFANGNFDKVGLQLWSDVVLPGTVKRNGALLLRAVYPRLFQDYIMNLPASNIVSDAAWLADPTKQGYCTLGDGSTNFRIMDSRGLFVRGFDDGRSVDSGRTVPGSYQDDSIKSHSHYLSRWNAADGDDSNIESYIQTSHSYGGDSTYRLAPANGGTFKFKVIETGDVETRGKNEAKIPLIFI